MLQRTAAASAAQAFRAEMLAGRRHAVGRELRPGQRRRLVPDPRHRHLFARQGEGHEDGARSPRAMPSPSAPIAWMVNCSVLIVSVRPGDIRNFRRRRKLERGLHRGFPIRQGNSAIPPYRGGFLGQSLVAHHAALADAFAADLELRLDQQQAPGAGGGEFEAGGSASGAK